MAVLRQCSRFTSFLFVFLSSKELLNDVSCQGLAVQLHPPDSAVDRAVDGESAANIHHLKHSAPPRMEAFPQTDSLPPPTAQH